MRNALLELNVRHIPPLFLCPFLTFGATANHGRLDFNATQQFVAVRTGPGQTEFLATTRFNSIRIKEDGWTVVDSTGHDRGGLRFVNALRGSEFKPLEAVGRASYFVGKDPSAWISG